MVGYNGNFPTPLAEHHKCPCCSYVLRDPLQTECGHRICKECYADLQRKSGRTGQIICPVDGCIVLPHQVFPDMYAKREVLRLPTYCMYRSSGCQWQGILKDYEDHIIRCEYEDIRCPNGCNQELPKLLIEQHLLQSCPRRLVECEYCKAKIPSEELEDHYDKCELFPVDCLYNCGAVKIPRRLLQQHHESECPNVVGACVYSYAGCNFKGTKDEVLDHLAKETTEHLRFAAKISNEMRIKSTELSRKFENEAKRAGILEQMVSGQAEDLEAIKFQCKELHDGINSLERKMDEINRSGQITRENLNQIQRGGPAIAMKMDRLRKQARLLEQKVGKALQKGSNVQEHIIGCEYEDIRCPNGCNQGLPKHLIEQHLLQSCPRRLVECEYCKAKIPSEELEEHYEKCELFPVDYRYERDAMKIPRRLLKQHHESECPNAVGARPYSFAGVNFKGTKDEVLDHFGKENTENVGNATKCSNELRIKSAELSRKFENEAKRAGILEQMVSGQASATSDSQTDKRIEKLENQLALQDVQIAELNLKLQLLEATSYDGKMTWKIDNFEKKRQDAIMGKSPFLHSLPFYTSPFGYKMCAKIYLNGYDRGKGTHISLFFVVMKGEYDALLEWPFPCKFTLKLLAQDGNAHIAEAFRPDPNSSSFRRPSSEMNIASGLSSFVSLQKLMKGPYIKNDSIFVQVIVVTAILANSPYFP